MHYCRAGKWGLKLREISLGLWHDFGGTAPVERSRARTATAPHLRACPAEVALLEPVRFASVVNVEA